MKIKMNAVVLASLMFSGVAVADSADNIVGAFLGATIAKDDHQKTQNDMTYGIEFERRMTEVLGAGITIETAPGAHHDDGVDIYLINAFYRPDDHWRIGVGIGTEKVGGYKGYSKNIERIGVSYDFHLGNGWGLAPMLNLDFIGGKKAYVTGAALTYSF